MPMIRMIVSVGSLSATADAPTATAAAKLASLRFEYIADCHLDTTAAAEAARWAKEICRKAADLRLRDSNWVSMVIPFGEDFVRLERE